MGALIVSDGTVLMVRRRNRPHAGLWSLPGGRVETGETMAEAVVRETREETGLDISCEDVIDYAELIGDGGHYVVVNFGAVVLGGHLEPGDDAEEVAWLALDSLACYDVVESVMDFLDQHGYVELA